MSVLEFVHLKEKCLCCECLFFMFLISFKKAEKKCKDLVFVVDVEENSVEIKCISADAMIKGRSHDLDLKTA